MSLPVMNIDWRQVVLNLRGAALMSAREISEHTGISETKLYRIASDGHYILRWHEAIVLIDLHYDFCELLHDARLMK